MEKTGIRAKKKKKWKGGEGSHPRGHLHTQQNKRTKRHDTTHNLYWYTTETHLSCNKKLSGANTTHRESAKSNPVKAPALALETLCQHLLLSPFRQNIPSPPLKHYTARTQHTENLQIPSKKNNYHSSMRRINKPEKKKKEKNTTTLPTKIK